MIRNRAVDWGQSLYGVVTAPNQFDALQNPTSNVTQAQNSGEIGWANSVYLACLLCSTLDEYDWTILGKKPLGLTNQKYFWSGWCYYNFRGSDPMCFDGWGYDINVSKVWIPDYGIVNSRTEIENVLNSYGYNRNLFFDLADD